MFILVIQDWRVVNFKTSNDLKNTLSHFEEILMISLLKCFIWQPHPILSSEKYKLLKNDENHKSMNATVSNLLFTQFYFWVQGYLFLLHSCLIPGLFSDSCFYDS